MCLPLSIILDKKKPDWFWVGKSQEVKQWKFWLPIHVNSFQSHSTWILSKLQILHPGDMFSKDTSCIAKPRMWRLARPEKTPSKACKYSTDLGFCLHPTSGNVQNELFGMLFLVFHHQSVGFSTPNRWRDVLKAIPVKLQRFHEVTPSSQLSHHLGFLVFLCLVFFLAEAQKNVYLFIPTFNKIETRYR